MYISLLKEHDGRNILVIVPSKRGSRFVSYLVGNSYEVRKTFFPSLELIGSNRIDKTWDISEYKFDEIIIIARNHIDRFISATLQIIGKEDVGLEEFFEFVNQNNFKGSGEDAHYSTVYGTLKRVLKPFQRQLMLLGYNGRFFDKRWEQTINGQFSIHDIAFIEKVDLFQRNFKKYKETNDKLTLWELLGVNDKVTEQQFPFIQQHIELKSFGEFCGFVRTPLVSRKLIESNKSKLNCSYDDIKKEIESNVNLKQRIHENYFNDYNHQKWRIT